MARNDGSKKSDSPVATSTNPLRLPAVATVPMPRELYPLPRVQQSVGSGRRRVRRTESAYIAPVTARLERTGKTAAVVARLKRLRRGVLNGASIGDAIADGQLDSWQAREPLSVATEAGDVMAWDARPGRTQAERVALVDKALALAGFRRRGGWSVTP